MKARIEPVRVEDMSALDDRLDRYIRRQVIAKPTEKAYRMAYDRFRDFADARGACAFPATVDLVAAWCVAAMRGTVRTGKTGPRKYRKPGDVVVDTRPLCTSDIGQMFAAIRWAHVDAGHPTPTDDPWLCDVRKGMSRMLAGAPVRRAVPLDPATITALTTLAPTWSPADVARRAIVQAMIDLQATTATLAAATPDMFAAAPGRSGHLTLDGTAHLLRCGHDEPQDVHCLRCSLIEVRAMIPDDAPFLFGVRDETDAVTTGRYRVRVAAERDAHQGWVREVAERAHRDVRDTGLIDLRDGRLTRTDRAGDDAELRRLLTWTTSADALKILLARVVVRAGWHIALRGGDIVRVRVTDLRRTDAGYTVRLTSAKNDQEKRGRTLGLRPTRDPNLDAVAALDDWLPLLRLYAVVNADLPLVPRPSYGVLRRIRPAGYQDMYGLLKSLQRKAGVAGFTPHSMRRGFGTTAAAQHATTEQIQTTLGVRRPETAHRYVQQAHALHRPAVRAVMRSAP